MPDTAPKFLALDLADEHATARLAEVVADILRPGDVVALSGDLGAGKTAFARHMLRRLADDEALDVPSPTFTLMQSYATTRGEVVHADLYRIGDPSELAEIGLDDLATDAILIVEWPERAGGPLAPDRLEVALSFAGEPGGERRTAQLTAVGRMAQRFARGLALRSFIDASGFPDARRLPVAGDVSTRSYERIVSGGRTAVLMDAPEPPPQPPVRDGLTYNAVAKRAETVGPFVAMANGLRAEGLSAPEIYAADVERGFLILEDLGQEGIAGPEGPIAERYEAATDLLAGLHARPLPNELPVDGNQLHILPRYDRDAFIVEVELFVLWFVARGHKVALGEAEHADFLRRWEGALAPVLEGPTTWVLRDYHSPNLLWLAERSGIERIGLLDFQDALRGPAAYDLVSLLQDARVDVPQEMELALLGRYLHARRAADPTTDPAKLARDYAILGAQRAAKIAGAFVRLALQGRRSYLRHLPRVLGYLARNLAHPALAEVKAWHDSHVPPGLPPALG